MKKLLVFIFLFVSLLSHSQDGNIIDWKEIIEKESISVKNQKLLKYFYNRRREDISFEIDTIYFFESIYVVGLNYNLLDEENVFLSLIDENYSFIDYDILKRKYSIIADGGHFYYNNKIEYSLNDIFVISVSHGYAHGEIEFAPEIEMETKTTTNYRINENEIIKEKKKKKEHNSFVTKKELKKLEKLNKVELRILRNYYFARHGKIFKSEDLTEYFNNNLPNYDPKSKDVTEKLTEVEKFLVKYILELEKKK